MLISQQIRAARHGVRLTVQELAERAGVSVSTLKRIEAADGVPAASARNLLQIQTALEAAGIEFIGGPGDAPGIRIHAARDTSERSLER